MHKYKHMYILWRRLGPLLDPEQVKLGPLITIIRFGVGVFQRNT